MKALPVVMTSPKATTRAIWVTLKLCKYKYCFGKWALFCLFCLWMRKNPIWDVTVLPQTSAVFSTTYSASQEGKGKVHGICQIDYTSKNPVIQNSKFLHHLLWCSFRLKSKPNILEICTICIHKISKDVQSRILPKQKKLSLKRASSRTNFCGQWFLTNSICDIG